MAKGTAVALHTRSSAGARRSVNILHRYALHPAKKPTPASLVAVVYDKQSRAITQTVIPATKPPMMRSNERCVMVPLGFYRTFRSLEDFCKAVPHLAPAFDPK